MPYTLTNQIADLFQDADAAYMSDRLRFAGVTSLTAPETDVITVNRIRLNAERVKAEGIPWTPFL